MSDKDVTTELKGEALDAALTLYQNTATISVLFDAERRVAGCTAPAIIFFGFSSEEELKQGFVELINNSIPYRQSTGRKSRTLSETLDLAVEKGNVFFVTELILHGKHVRLNITLKTVEYKGSMGVAAYINEQSEVEERSRLMMDVAPFVSAYYDPDKRRITDCNMEAVRLLGFSSKEDYLERHDEVFPDAKSRKKMQKMIDNAIKTGREVFEFSFKHTSGEMIPVEITAICSNWRKHAVVSLYARDLGEIKKAEYESELHMSLLQAINDVASVLIESTPKTVGGAVCNSLKIIGEAAEVDRAYIWDVYESDKKLFCRQLYEWSEHAEPQQGKEFTVSFDLDDTPMLKECIITGVSMNGPIGDVVDDEGGVLAQQGIVSILLLPIFFHSKPWGFIGFDDCRVKRAFSKAKEAVLHSGGVLIASSIERNRMTNSIIKATDKLKEQGELLSAANEVARILLETEQDDFDISVYNALRELGACADANAVSIWKNRRDEDGRLGCSLHSRWSDNEAAYQLPEDLFLDYERFNPFWDGSQKGLSVLVSELDDDIKNIPLIRGATSLLLLPLNISGDFWGMIAFSNNTRELLFSGEQKRILRSSGMLIASAIVRNEIMESLVEARESALASARSKSGFLSRMSHEIRTPINAIIGMTTLAKKSGDINRVRHYLDTVDSSSRQLLDIINDVLDMSKIDANKLEIQNEGFDFESMLRRVLNVVQIKADEKKIDFRLNFPYAFKRMIISDELRLSQVLINLLSNSVKFTGDYGVITLKIRETPLGGDRSLLRMEVIDNGVGISPENIDKVFQLFEQGDGSITRQFGGTGIGLSICRHIINMMGGKIWAESEPGQGSKFIVEIETQWGDVIGKGSFSGNLPPDLRVLVVDDAPEILEYFREILAGFSIECDTAENGYDAVRMAAEKVNVSQPYDVVFIDWFMPGMNGGETTREIKKIMHGDVIVIMISSAAWSEINKDVSAAGVRYFLPKPILSSDLYNMLLRLASRRQEKDKKISAGDEESWQGNHILLVEDNEINREIVKGLLEDTGIIIDYAENGLEGVEMFTAAPNRYKLILMDVHMPVMDGLTATRRIRASGAPNASTVQIIAMTADAFKEDEQASANAGMNGHISKPFDASELYFAIRKALE